MVVRLRRIDPDEWKPIGVEALEANALVVVRSQEHRSVIAGPGAGKTELLAQRAAYLLQTGISPIPQRILAISFKKSAASNLADRVSQRCEKTQAARFDSLTFDAFAKSLVDRFGQALPERWRPRPDYEILFPNFRMYDNFVRRTLGAPPDDVGTYRDVQAISTKAFEKIYLVGSRLPENDFENPTPAQWAADQFWQSSLHGGKKSFLSFPMIGRLAELLLRISPMARDALRLTYSHLFMDEFQDTTPIQYDLMHTIFSESDTVVTAVGDNKQQIMRWALAMDTPFAVFDQDFGALPTPLFNNYRSSPELVRIQHVLAQALDAKAAEPVSMTEDTIDGDSCAIWEFSTPEVEAAHLARFVAEEMKSKNLEPRDFALLVRQKASDYSLVLEPAFLAEGILIRNEADMIGKVPLQDLLSEEASVHVLRLLRLATAARAGKYWTECVSSVSVLRGLLPEDHSGLTQESQKIDAFVRQLGLAYPDPATAMAHTRQLVDEIIEFLDRDALTSAFPAYGQGDWLDGVVEAITLHLRASLEGTHSWTEALDDYEGKDAVPLMTVHKAKGLEYHTVVFIGLDDGAWWSFAQDQIEGTAGFFVAFTRAKQRVVFTYCARRGTRTGIATLYDLLQQAGVNINVIK